MAQLVSATVHWVTRPRIPGSIPGFGLPQLGLSWAEEAPAVQYTRRSINKIIKRDRGERTV